MNVLNPFSFRSLSLFPLSQRQEHPTLDVLIPSFPRVIEIQTNSYLWLIPVGGRFSIESNMELFL